MDIPHYTKASIRRLTNSTIYTKAELLYKQGAVTDVIYSESDEWEDCIDVFASVQTNQNEVQVFIELHYSEGSEYSKNDFPYDDIECNCTCRSYVACCEHSIAALMSLQDLTSSGVSIDELYLNRWLESVQTENIQQKKQEHDPSYELFFELHLPTANNPLSLFPKFYRRLKKGGLGSPKNWNQDDLSNRHLTSEDVNFLVNLNAATQLSKQKKLYYDTCFLLNEERGELVFEQLVHSGKVHLEGNCNALVSLGKARDITFQWKEREDQKQQLTLALPKSVRLFFINRPWYFNKTTKVIGPINTNLSRHALTHLATMPPVNKEQAMKVNSALAMLPNLINIPALPVSEQTHPIGQPTPHLYLHNESLLDGSKEVIMPTVLLSFQYDGALVPWYDDSSLVKIKDNPHCSRNTSIEFMALQTLTKSGLVLLKKTPFLNDNKELANLHLFINHSPFDFWQEVIPVLTEQGWIIQIAEDYEHRLVEEEAQEWYANVMDGETSDWFSFELGVMVQGEKINLLPIIQNLLHNLSEKQQLSDITNQVVYAKLPNNHYLPIPGARLSAMMQTLIELFDKKALSIDDTLRLSKSEAMRLMEIEKAVGATQLRWLSRHKMQVLAEKITGFKGIDAVPVPQGLKTILRPYQQEGLNWMQFLREYELAGILADDMGLGKTVQALSHILLEKESGRLDSPALVIAPTSLMYNWEQECMRFAPDLKVLTLHGASRKAYLDTLSDYDLILTTYPLILRDKESLLKQKFHLLILDEAQYIKNSKSLSTQIVLQLKAKHRLCLTGTPMENHLGELWSLFHFLMPGLLGNASTFTSRYRTPIEKHGDNERRKMLSKRIAPFLLRRTKSLVAKELPPKIEMISYVELEHDQRDLYETIRIAMEDKVRKEISKLGLARSHIIILDALLKLRQICCDPGLLKKGAEEKQYSSCKINLLKDMLPELIEEGRRILIFSSFTQMLDIIEQTVNQLKIDYVRLTGETIDRRTPIDRFQNLEVPLFLISLKAGGTGLNLTAADTVIHIDPWWNPAAENQATDRAYRIGQDKTVFVYKIVTKGTVEEKILAMQEKKQALADGIFSDKTTEKSKLSEDDLQVLFSGL